MKIKASNNLSDSQEVDITAPNGKIITCIARGSVLIAKAKIEIYGMGKVSFPEEKEWTLLKQEKKENQRKFSKNPHKKSRLKELKQKAANQRKSQANLSAILKVGLSDSASDIAKIVEHLLDVGEQVTVKEQGQLLRSKLAAPLGLLTVLSAWKVIDNDKMYLTTIKFIPPKDIEEGT